MVECLPGPRSVTCSTHFDSRYNANHSQINVFGYSTGGSNFACWNTYMHGCSRGACETNVKQKQAPVNNEQSLLAAL